MEEYCEQNPYTPICGYGGTGGMMTCPYSGASVSRGEDCPEFSGAGGGGGGGSCANSYTSNCGEDDEEEDVDEPLDVLDTAIDEILGCMHDSDISPVSIYRASVTISYQDVPGAWGAYSCQLKEIRINKDAIEADSSDHSTSNRKLFALVLIHEFIHARSAAEYGCPPWDNPDFGPSTKEEAETYTRQESDRQYLLQFGARSPLDPGYDPDIDGTLSCPD